MSHELCEYCHEQPAYKTNGQSKYECSNHAICGDCSGRKPFVTDNKAGRNEKCLCGSGFKYKHCCINKSIEE